MKTIRIEFPLKNSIRLSEPDAVKAMTKGLEKLIEFGAIKGELDNILHSYEFTDKLGYAIAVIDKEALVDPSKLNSIGASLVYTVNPNDVVDTPEDKTFSAATIQERLRINSLNPKVKFRLTILDYKKYWKSKQVKLEKSPETVKRLKNMFLVDLMGIFTEILPYIQEGKQLSTLIGVNAITEGLTNASRDLSLAYKKALAQSKTGQLSKSVFKTLQVKYTEFINLLVPQVFPGMNEVLKSAKESDKQFSEVFTEGILTIISNNTTKLTRMIEDIKSRLETGNVTVLINPESNSSTYGFNKGEDNINSIESKQLESQSTVEVSRKKFVM